jgi:hypothetical protein
MEIVVIQIGVLCDICRAFPLGEQLGNRSGFRSTRTNVVERQFGMESPTEDGER